MASNNGAAHPTVVPGCSNHQYSLSADVIKSPDEHMVMFTVSPCHRRTDVHKPCSRVDTLGDRGGEFTRGRAWHNTRGRLLKNGTDNERAIWTDRRNAGPSTGGEDSCYERAMRAGLALDRAGGDSFRSNADVLARQLRMVDCDRTVNESHNHICDPRRRVHKGWETKETQRILVLSVTLIGSEARGRISRTRVRRVNHAADTEDGAETQATSDTSLR